MCKICQIQTHTTHLLVVNLGVVKFCSLRGEGRLKNGVRIKHMITLDYIEFCWHIIYLKFPILCLKGLIGLCNIFSALSNSSIIKYCDSNIGLFSFASYKVIATPTLR